MNRRKKIALVLFGAMLIIATPAIAETFLSSFGTSKSPIHHQTDNGLEVVTTKDYAIQSGNPFTSESYNLSTQNKGYLNASTAGSGGSVTVDQIEGDWTNVSSVTAPSSANITLDASDKNQTSIGGGIDAVKIRDWGGGAGQTGVEDGAVDLVYSARAEATIVVNTNATQGTAYGLVDPDTNQGLDVAVADANGRIAFTEVPAKTDQQVRIQELGTLTIREETSPHDKITTTSPMTVEVKFFEDQKSEPTIVERDTSNGEIDLTGLPVDQQFAVTVMAPGYHNRTVIINDLAQQETAFLIDKNESTLENRFVVNDRTGNYPPETTELIVQRAINRSEYGQSGGFQWTNIAGDDLGADEAFVVNLEESRRYRILVRNEDSDTRVLGAYTPETTGTVRLNIGSVVVDPDAPNTVGWAANRTNRTGQPVKVNFQYNDTTENTTRIWLHIYEYGNESNELLANTSFSGPFGVFTNSQNVPSDENQTEWVVDFVAERPGENIRGQVVVGGQRVVLTDMPSWLVSLIFLGTIWAVAGIFSQFNGSIGGLVVAGMGGMFFFVGFVPPYLGGGVVALSLITAAILFVRDRSGGAL
jgi:hypothetical protein